MDSLDTSIDFTQEQKKQILEDTELRDNLIYWYSSNLSDAFWTENNYEFITLIKQEYYALEYNENNPEIQLIEDENQIDDDIEKQDFELD